MGTREREGSTDATAGWQPAAAQMKYRESWRGARRRRERNRGMSHGICMIGDVVLYRTLGGDTRSRPPRLQTTRLTVAYVTRW